jgi:hypothetical protein
MKVKELTVGDLLNERREEVSRDHSIWETSRKKKKVGSLTKQRRVESQS